MKINPLYALIASNILIFLTIHSARPPTPTRSPSPLPQSVYMAAHTPPRLEIPEDNPPSPPPKQPRRPSREKQVKIAQDQPTKLTQEQFIEAAMNRIQQDPKLRNFVGITAQQQEAPIPESMDSPSNPQKEAAASHQSSQSVSQTLTITLLRQQYQPRTYWGTCCATICIGQDKQACAQYCDEKCCAY